MGTTVSSRRSRWQDCLSVVVSALAAFGCCRAVVTASSGDSTTETLVPITPVVRSRGVQLLIEPVQMRSRDEPRLRMTLRYGYGEEQPIWLNGSFGQVLDDSQSSTIDYEVVEAKTGFRPSKSCFVRPNADNVPGYLLLYPGSELTHIVSVMCFDLSRGTTWRVKAKYKDVRSDAPHGPRFAARLLGEVVSNEVIVHTDNTVPQPPARLRGALGGE